MRHQLMQTVDVYFQVTGFSQMELNEIRPFFSLAFKRLLQLDPQESERLEQAADEPEELEDPELKEDDFGYGAS